MPATLRAAADLSPLFKTDAGADAAKVDEKGTGGAGGGQRLEGMKIVKDNLFTGQRLRLAGVAFLWCRLHESNGALRLADTVRRFTAPLEVDLRGTAAGGAFWHGDDQARR